MLVWTCAVWMGVAADSNGKGVRDSRVRWQSVVTDFTSDHKTRCWLIKVKASIAIMFALNYPLILESVPLIRKHRYLFKVFKECYKSHFNFVYIKFLYFV